MAIAVLVERANERLARGGVGLRLELRGHRLGLRGPLPSLADPGRLQRRRLSLGLPATPAGLEQALERLEELLRQLATGRFDPAAWGSGGAGSPPAPPAPALPAPALPALAAAPPALGELLVGFERAFFADPRRRRRPAGSRSTWEAAYRPYLRRLERAAAATPAAPLDVPLLEAVLEGYDLASRSRQQAAIALAALARHAGLALPDDWSERAAGYGLHRARFRPLPSDGRILEVLELIPNPAWRLVYGLMATYGLRNHEAFFCDLSALAPGGDHVIRVLPTSKTGEHQVWPFQPSWVEEFGLARLAEGPAALPPVSTDLRRTTLKRVGQRVAEQFRRYDLPITPYDLRHAWAVRTIHIGLPDTVAARMMGHSVAIHTRTYHHWITRRDQQQAVDAALARLRAA
ncbi:MAG: site-specific integrase [Cyanobacteriota bacterium]|nr:site-specific integrase [Cyanobacteriota bacterium]